MITSAGTDSSTAASTVQRPSPEILDVAGEVVQLRILRQRGGAEIEAARMR